MLFKWTIGLALGGAEIGLVTWLMIESIQDGGWWILGLIAYFLYSASIGGISNLFSMALSALLFSLLYVYLGFWWSFAAFVALLVIFEFLPSQQSQTEE